MNTRRMASRRFEEERVNKEVPPLTALRNLLNFLKLRRNILIHPSLSILLAAIFLKSQGNTLRRIIITFTLPHDIGVEKKGNSIVL